jgi:hypothetical protein
MPSTSSRLSDALRANLERLKALRAGGPSTDPRLASVKQWQAARLARTYADLAAQPRYRAATAFFLDDLYGPKDFSARDAALLKIVPVMTRVLPAKAVETAALSVELEALTEELDHRLAAALRDARIDERSYADAYRRSTTPAERRQQISLMLEAGRRLDTLVRWPFVSRTLKLMRTPARLAGLDDLQDFLERGFHAFEAMGGAAEFLATVEQRENELLNRLFSGDSLTA